MSEATTDNAAASAPTVTDSEQSPPTEKPPDMTVSVPDQQLMEVLARTQNECLSELGYRPSLLSEFHELQTTYMMLHADNQKLYSDNCSLAQFIAQQNQRMDLLQKPADPQKRTIVELHEILRTTSNERDEIQARLHAALYEVSALRKELSKFVPGALISSQVLMPAPTSIPQHAQYMQHSQAVSHRVAVPAPMPVAMQGHPSIPLPLHPVQYYRVPPPSSKGGIPGARPHNLLPHHRGSVPMLLPIDTSVTPAIAQHRRPSAPAALTFAHSAPGQSPASASPLNTFSGLTLASSPATPVHGPRHPSGSRPPSSRGIHVTPPVTSNPSSSSLAGAIIDLTQDETREDSARKRRKLEHPPDAGTSQLQASGVVSIASPVTYAGPTAHNEHIQPMQTLVAQPFTVPQSHSISHMNSLEHPSRPHPPQLPVNPILAPAMPPHHSQNQRALPPQPHAQELPQPQSHTPLAQIIAQSKLMPHAQPSPQSPTPTQLQPPVHSQASPQEQPPAHSQVPPVGSSNVAAEISPADAQKPDAVMAEASSEPSPTVEEESIEANYDDDEADESKLWCRMCRSRFKGGHTTEEPKPFVNASPQQLIEHCETVHPRGWEILKSKVAAQREP